MNRAKDIDSDDYWKPAKHPEPWQLFKELSLKQNGMS